MKKNSLSEKPNKPATAPSRGSWWVCESREEFYRRARARNEEMQLHAEWTRKPLTDFSTVTTFDR